MHCHNIQMPSSAAKQCDDCWLARYIPSTLLKKLYVVGIVSRKQLVVDGEPVCFKEFKQVYPNCKLGAQRHRLNILISPMRV